MGASSASSAASPRAACTRRKLGPPSSSMSARLAAGPPRSTADRTALPAAAPRRPRPAPPTGSTARRRQRRSSPEGELKAARDAPLGGQAVLEGVMMRGVSNWAVAVRKPTAEQLAEGERSPEEAALGEIEVSTYPLDSVLRSATACCACRSSRRGRARRLAGDRLPRARDLGQRPAARPRSERGGEPQEIPQGGVGGHGRARAGARGRAVLPDPGRADEPDQAPAGLLVPVLADRGAGAHEHLPRLHAAALAVARPAAGVRVPRRRAQDDLLLRGGPAADAEPTPSASRACTRAAARASCWW